MSSKQQDYTEYTVDLSQLTKERPLGVTGILRCQNSADFLDACIESCIEGLDELIAVYHNCTDETANIMFHNKKLFDGGLIWLHLRPCLQKHTETYQYWYEKAEDRFIPVEKFKKCNYSKLKRRKNLFIRSRFESMFSYFYSAQRHSIHIGKLETRGVSRKDEFAGFGKIQNRV